MKYQVKMEEYVSYLIEVEAETIEEALTLVKKDPYSYPDLTETYCEREILEAIKIG